MNVLLASSIDALGWSLLHFLWQGTVVALLAAGGLQLLRNNSPQWRYLVAGLAFLILVITFGVTLGYHWESAPAVEVVEDQSGAAGEPD